MFGIVVPNHNLTGIVVGVTLALSLRISPRSSEGANARVRTEAAIVAAEMRGECRVSREVDSGVVKAGCFSMSTLIFFKACEVLNH